MNGATITVAVATMDRPEALNRCLSALLSAKSLPDEVLVIDQGRRISSRSVVEQHRTSGIRVVYIPQEACGLSASRNAALANFTSSVIAVTDDDCVPESGWIEAIRRAFDSAQPPDAVTGPVFPLGPDAPGLYAVSSRTSTEATEYRARTAPWVVGTGANFAITREWIARIGKFDERLGAGSPGGAGEDMDMIYRLLRAGARIAYEPSVLIRHERQPISRRMSTRFSYGCGIGAFCGLWLRRHDAYALKIVGRWVYLRCRLLTRAFVRRQWRAMREEVTVLKGTAKGLIYAFRTRAA